MRSLLLIALLAFAACSAESSVSKIDSRTFVIESAGIPGGSEAPNRRTAERICPGGYRVMDKTAHQGTPRSGPRRARHFHELDDPMPLDLLAQRTDMSKYALAVPALLVGCVLVLADCTPQAKVTTSQAQIPPIVPGTARVWFFRGWDSPSGQGFVYGAAPTIYANGAAIGAPTSSAISRRGPTALQ